MVNFPGYPEVGPCIEQQSKGARKALSSSLLIAFPELGSYQCILLDVASFIGQDGQNFQI